MAQRYEDLNGEGQSKFYLQYFFPLFLWEKWEESVLQDEEKLATVN